MITAAGTDTTIKEELVCEYCKKSFRRISTLSAHLCEPKRRAKQEKETGVQIGLKAFNAFTKSFKPSSKDISYQEFCKSQYYLAFVRFGQYVVSVGCVNVEQYLKWLLKNEVRLDIWNKDSNYDLFLIEYIRNERVELALERSIKTMTTWAEENNSVFSHFFLYANANKICQLINAGKISPWVVYNCESGQKTLENLSSDQLQMIYSLVDPEFWIKRFKKDTEDVEWIKGILQIAGL